MQKLVFGKHQKSVTQVMWPYVNNSTKNMYVMSWFIIQKFIDSISLALLHHWFHTTEKLIINTAWWASTLLQFELFAVSRTSVTVATRM